MNIINECPHVASGTRATMIVHLSRLDDYVCTPCFVTNYRDNEACTLAWEADPIPGVELPACPYCGSTTHALPQCAAFAAQAGQPLIAGLRTELEAAQKTISALYAACDEAHVTLWHYDLLRRPNGVDWEPVAEMQAKLIEQLWQAILLVQPERQPKEGE